MTLDRVVVIGAGRVGLTLARALVRSGVTVRVLGRRSRPLRQPLGVVETEWEQAIESASLVIIAVPDDAIGEVAATLARQGHITASHVVVHTSGLHDRSALAPLEATGAALGSWHPLQTFAADGDTTALAGSPAAVEGDDRAREAGRVLADRLHLRPVVEIPAAGKAAYHAGAVFAANYLVVLADVAASLARDAGAADAAASLYLPLMRRTLANYSAGGSGTLTGPISRGDAGTVRRHLEVLTGAERALYVGLGREALRLARAGGLNERTANEIEALLY